MSILQELEMIRKELGSEKYQAIEEFIYHYPEHRLGDVYYNPDVYKIFDGWYTRKFALRQASETASKLDPEKIKLRDAANKLFDHYLVCTKIVDSHIEVHTSASAATAILILGHSAGIYDNRQFAALKKKVETALWENPCYDNEPAQAAEERSS